jgi:O-methyltransferase
MSKLLLRKLLNRFHLLESARALKKKVVSAENEFKPADPRLLVSVHQCLHWLHARGLCEGSDYLEFGIFRGFNLWYTQALARALGIQDMRFFGFDSFMGLPPVEGIDAGAAFHEGDFSAYKDEVEMFLSRFGVNWHKTRLIKGFFDQSLTPELKTKEALRRCSFCLVDCDLYSSAVTVLKFVEPLLGDESILLFDDWSDFGVNQNKGEPKAFAEFEARNAEVFASRPFEDLVALGGKGKAFIMRRKTAPARAGE